MTNWPQSRASQYGAAYHEMLVLYETSSRNNAMDLEDRLFDYYWNNYDTCENRAPGYGEEGQEKAGTTSTLSDGSGYLENRRYGRRPVNNPLS